MAYTITNPPLASNKLLAGEDELYQLNEDFQVEFSNAQQQYSILIPAGFICDGSSIPRFLWTLIGMHKDGKNREPSLVHDWMYMHQGKLPEASFSRKQADRLYYDMLTAYGVPNKKAWRSFKGVRLFGKGHWKKKDRDMLQRNSGIPSLGRILQSLKS